MMKKFLLVLSILMSSFVMSDIAYFESPETYNFYSYGDTFAFENEVVTNPFYFITVNKEYEYIDIDSTEQVLYSSSYKYYDTDNSFYTLQGKMKVDRLENSYSDSTVGILFFYQPESDNSIRLNFNYVSSGIGRFVITQSDGLRICDNSKIYSVDNYSVGEWINYEIYVKNASDTIINFKTWNDSESEPELYQRNCTLQTGNPPEFGTFGVFGKNVTARFSSINVTGYDIIDSTEDVQQSYTLDYTFLMLHTILIAIGVILFSLIFVSDMFKVFFGLYLMFYGIYLIGAVNYLLGVTVVIMMFAYLMKVLRKG